MCRTHHFVGLALLAFLNRGVLSDAVPAPKPYNFWSRDSDSAVNTSGLHTTANSTSLYPDSNFNVSEECVLWDSTCHGDKQNAASIFFGKTLSALLENECFTVTDSAEDVVVGLNNEVDEDQAPYDPAQCPGGISGSPPATSSLWSSLKSWMREPACASSSLLYRSAVSLPPAHDTIYGCCGPCAIGGPNVDVYYWPSPEANTSCLNFIGTSVNPPTEGATTDAGYTYWGYTPTDANIYHQIVTTMVYTSINGIYFKMPMSNPWESKPGASTSTNPGMWSLPSTTLPWGTPNIKQRAESPEAPIQARANPIAIRNPPHAPMNESKWDVIRNDSSPRSIVTSGSHTFTSPSIYVNFYSLSATDSCGYRGTTIDSTLVAFAPGELSTVATAMYPAIESGITSGSVYNFDNLPCPPMSVMSSQWYKPEPGEPYRPLIIFPSKLLDIDPLWNVCTPGYFTGYDPPRTLDPATAMVPKVTPPSNPSPDPSPATPAATQENLPKRTTTPADPTKTSSDPSLAKSHGGGGVHVDPSQQADPLRGTNKASADSAPNNQGNEDLQRQSLQEEPASTHLKNHPTNHASPNNAANSDLDQPANNMHASGDPSMEDVSIMHQPQPLATSAQALITAVSGSHHVSATVEGYNDDGVDIRPGGSAPDARGQQIAVDSSNDPQIGGQTAHVEPVVSLATTAIANHVITPLLKGVAIQGITLNDGGPGAIVASTTFSLDTSGNMFVNGHSYRIHNESPVPTTINGEAVMPLPTGISIHSTTLTPNAPALVISGTSYSLDSSSNLHFGGSSYAPPVKIGDVEPTQVNAIAGQPVIELPAGVSIAGTMPTADVSIIQTLSGVPVTLDSSSLMAGPVAISVQNNPSSGSFPELISGGSSSQGLETANGIRTLGKKNSSTLLAFTGGSGGRKPDFSILLLGFTGAWTFTILRSYEVLT